MKCVIFFFFFPFLLFWKVIIKIVLCLTIALSFFKDFYLNFHFPYPQLWFRRYSCAILNVSLNICCCKLITRCTFNVTINNWLFLGKCKIFLIQFLEFFVDSRKEVSKISSDWDTIRNPFINLILGNSLNAWRTPQDVYVMPYLNFISDSSW